MTNVRILHPPPLHEMKSMGIDKGHLPIHDGFIYGKQIICEQCAIEYVKFLKLSYHEEPNFCTCNECKEKLKEIKGTTVRCAWCNDPVFIMGEDDLI